MNHHQQFQYKTRGYGCDGCPIGSYAYTCKNCQLVHYAFRDIKTNTPLLMMECSCLKNKYKNQWEFTSIPIDRQFCDFEKVPDVANCDGKLTCGICFGSSLYHMNGNMMNY